MADTTVKSGITNSPFIGVENFHVAKLLTDPDGGTATYDTPIHIPQVREINVAPSSNTADLYADNQAVATATTTSKYELTIDTATLALEYKALLLGHTYAAGKITVKSTDTAPYFMVAFESTKANGKKRFVKFAKVKFSEPKEDSKTKEENISFNTPQMTATAIYRTSDSVCLEQADEEADGYVETTGANWYTTTTGTQSG